MVSLVLFETGGNQSFIFGVNKLVENIGASQLTYEAGTSYVLRAVADAGGPTLLSADEHTTRRNILTQAIYIEAGVPVEVVYATSGKALLLVADPTNARSIVTAVTKRALIDAPGLDLCGAVEEFDWGHGARAAVKAVHERLACIRQERLHPVARYSRIPFVAPCHHSGLPAASIQKVGPEDRYPLARECISKRGAADRWFARIGRVLAADEATRDLKFAENPDQMERWFDESPWTAVVHADGNKLGELFRTFGRKLADREYVDRLRKLAVAVEEVTERAFRKAVPELLARSRRHDRRLRVVPIVLGGDDFTVLCAGSRALAFARTYLDAFEAESRNPLCDGVIARTNNNEPLTACAGVAITKRHYPFHSAYDLAEELIRSAKVVKARISRPCSALDFHVLFDSTFGDLGEVRSRLQIGGARFTRKPFVTTTFQAPLPTDQQAWFDAHRFSVFETRVDAITARDESGARKMPNSQLHDLRAALFMGADVAEARARQMRHRYQHAGFDRLLERGDGSPTLFAPVNPDPAAADPVNRDTAFLDALEGAPFWKE